MDLFYESGLFMELGEVVGHDPVLYEDISKQHEFNTSSPLDTYHVKTEIAVSELGVQPHGYSARADDCELDSLLAEGNHLLEQLMAANGLELSGEDSVDLSGIDELAEEITDSISSPINTYSPLQHDDLFSDLQQLPESHVYDDYYLIAASPSSSITTLPSEPSSPVNLFPVEQHDELKQEIDFTDLLQSILDDNDETTAEFNSSCYEDSILSPATSDDSYTTGFQSPDDVWSWNESDSSAPKSPSKPKKKSKATPYSKLPPNRKERKKQQNKEAAIRYREKKRSEVQVIMGEEAELAEKNKQLKTDVLNLEREILCMKELLSDVFNIHSLD